MSDDGADGKRAVEITTRDRDDVWRVLQRGVQRHIVDRLVDI